MLYKDFLKTVSGCPFCEEKAPEVIKENEKAILRCAIAPYSHYHMVVVPKRHVVDYLELSREERDSMDDLVADGIKVLETLGIKDYSVIVRTGDKESIGKSIDHIHFNIVPKVRLGMIDAVGVERIVLTDKEVAEIVEKAKSVLA